MDNKQKKQMLKLIYKSIIMLIFICAGFTIFFGINLYNMEYKYNFVGILFVILVIITLFITLLDTYKTTKIKNKFNLSLFTYVLILITLVTFSVITASIIAGKTIIVSSYVVCLTLLFISQILLIINIVIGIKLSKFYQNITTTIDSLSETPNFNDELMLKKTLDELERKLEIKKVQEKINQVKKELDEN